MLDLMIRLHEWDGWTEWTPANNDLDPTEPDPADYGPWWDTEREWIEPHPDMEGYRCSAGWHHVAYQRRPRPPVGLACITDLPELAERRNCHISRGA